MYVGAALVPLDSKPLFDWARALDTEHVQSVLRRVSAGQRSGQRRGRYTPLDCNVVLKPPMEKDYLVLKVHAHPASAATMTMTCLPMVSWSAASSRQTPHQSENRGCGRSPSGITRIARQLADMPQHARMRWRRLQKAGGGNEVHEKAPPVLGAGLRELVGLGSASLRPSYFADFGVRIRTAMRQPGLTLGLDGGRRDLAPAA
jgi:hypothetical protein